MKKVLFLMFAMAFTTAVSAQTMPSMKVDDVKSAGTQAMAEQNPKMDKQIKDALMMDEDLQKETINYLKENPETTSALTKIIADNTDSIDGVMKSVLGDSQLASAAIDWISNNPEMLNKVMKIVGM